MSGELRREKVWDPVTRVWHWLLAIVVIAGWSLGEFMSFSTIRWHFYCGYAVLALVAFRLLWGCIGPAPVRLRALVPRPSSLAAYMRTLGRREPSGLAGHNPLGALAVLAMLVALLAQAGTGLFIESEDYFEPAPLNHLVSGKTAKLLMSVHELCAKVILVLVALHLAAMLFYLLWKRENLVTAMFTGWKRVRTTTQRAD